MLKAFKVSPKFCKETPFQIFAILEEIIKTISNKEKLYFYPYLREHLNSLGVDLMIIHSYKQQNVHPLFLSKYSLI